MIKMAMIMMIIKKNDNDQDNKNNNTKLIMIWGIFFIHLLGFLRLMKGQGSKVSN